MPAANRSYPESDTHGYVCAGRPCWIALNINVPG